MEGDELVRQEVRKLAREQGGTEISSDRRIEKPSNRDVMDEDQHEERFACDNDHEYEDDE
ncbi:MAG: hypothetical protein E6Q97_17450 [Desulfurellales bacterium]|nr:MAG: hypothetical protein E6Q97_17450 [Desulfurellales bacterium]